MTRTLAAILLLLSVAALAGAPEKPMDGFDHGKHEKALERQQIPCVACHRMGVESNVAAATDGEVLRQVPGQACHFCHTDAASTERKAPSRCETCHQTVGPPESHAAGWLEDHGGVARMKNCSDCHRGSFCVDCHERRDPVRQQVHDRGWLGIHGIAVLADPAACGSCHRQDYCVACHAGGAR